MHLALLVQTCHSFLVFVSVSALCWHEKRILLDVIDSIRPFTTRRSLPSQWQ